MTTTATKIQKISDRVYQILCEKGLSKIFNSHDYEIFKKESRGMQNRAQYIAEQFIFWNSNNLTDFADYEF